MATMIPDFFLEDDNNRSQAEKRVYFELKEKLPSDYHIFYNINFLSWNRLNDPFDGEIDFILAHPNYGIICLEVKGGGIGFDQGVSEWFSRNRHNNKYIIKNPVQQARNNKYCLRRFLENSRSWPNKKFSFGHAIFLPDCGRFIGAPPPDIDEEIILWSCDFKNLHNRVENLFKLWHKRDCHNLGQTSIHALKNIIKPKFEAEVTLAAGIIRQKQDIIRLSDEQASILTALEHNNKVIIQGGAGTGKTILAVRKASQLACTGKKVLFTCYNRPIAKFIAQKTETVENLTVANYHRLCHKYCQEASPALEKLFDSLRRSSGQAFWNIESSALLREAISILGDECKFDAIIVDEGQDFRDIWWETLFELQKSSEDSLYIFKDTNQDLFSANTPITDLPYEFCKFNLTKNYRNTEQIYSLSNSYYNKSNLEFQSGGPSGSNVTLLEIKSENDIETQVEANLINLLKDENIDPLKIAVICNSRPEDILKNLIKRGKIENVPINVEQDGVSRKGVIVSGIKRFKGLESDFVILTGLEKLQSENAEKLLYVATSRASFHLIIVATKETIARLGLDGSGIKTPPKLDKPA